MTELVVREYLRVSKDTGGTGRSPDQQHAENVRAIHEQGWTLHPEPPYRDTDRSASRYAKLAREDFRRLVADLASGEFGADVLAIWESSRGSRRVGEWVDLVDLCKERNILIWVTTHGRAYDPARARDRRSLLEDAVDAEYESDKISERRRRSARAAAEEGRPHGRNIYGYRRVYDSETRELLRVEPRPGEAEVIEEAARRVLARESFYSIARDFNARGVPTRSRKRVPPLDHGGWTPSEVKQMLRLPAYAGKRDHKGVIVGDGMWPALVPFEQWQHLQAIMGTQRSTSPRDHTAKYLLTGIALCGVCGTPMKCNRRNYVPRRPAPDGVVPPPRRILFYICPGIPGKLRSGAETGWHAGMNMNTLDEYVINLVLGHLRTDGRDERSDVHLPDDEALRAGLRREIAEHEAYLESVRAQAARSRRFELALDQEARVRPLIYAARRKLAALDQVDPLAEILAQAADARQTWETLDLREQRRIIRATLTPVVNRVGKKWNRHSRPAERVDAVWH